MKRVLLLDSERNQRSERGREGSDMDELGQVQVQVQVAKLTVDVENIKKDVADIKLDLRRIEGDMRRIEDRLTGMIHSLREDFSSAKVWALGLYFGLAGSMLFVMAKGFKWI
jgi:hypothetical protein